MLVRLNGPSLLPSKEGGSEHVLAEIGKSLFVSLAQEITSAFRRRAEAHGSRECLEIAAALKVDLYNIPTEAWLRELWDRAGCLPHGILFSTGQAADQGLRELVALSSALQTYAVIAFKIDEQRGKEGGSENETRVEGKVTAEGESLKTTLTGLFAAGAAGGATAVAGAATPYAVLAGALVGLASLTGLSFTSTRTRKRGSTYKMTYLPDRTVPSLARTLPDLVGRIFEAGLAPVFVVDELDKVRNLENRMDGLVREMKQFVTERAFFCFLVGRRYFEWFTDSRRRRPYGPEYTFFSNRLFVTYSTDDLHGYLKEVLQVS